MFHPAPAPTQEDIEHLVERISKRILRFLQRRGVITRVTAPGNGEVTVVPDETLGEQDPLLAKLLAAATTGAAPAGPQSPLRLIALVKNQDIARKILVAMHLPASVPELHPARPPPPADREARDAEDWLN